MNRASLLAMVYPDDSSRLTTLFGGQALADSRPDSSQPKAGIESGFKVLLADVHAACGAIREVTHAFPVVVNVEIKM